MNYQKSTLWTELPEAQRMRIVVILVQMLLRQLRKQEKEVNNDVNVTPNSKG